MLTSAIERLVDLALEEDIGPGDITTAPLVSPGAAGRGEMIAKQALVLAGLDVARCVFARLDAAVVCRPCCPEGERVAAGQVIMTLDGPLEALLLGERTALNFVQRLAGIATWVRRHVDRLPPGAARLVDTRKTTPGWRVLEKRAVRLGGAGNHRLGLFDGALIKDNHIAVCGGIAAAVARLRASVGHLVKIEVETGSLDEVRQAVAAGADVIMLDNMTPDQVRTAVQWIAGRALVEVSGNVDAACLEEMACSGADLVSMGALTHSAPAVDISMRIHATGDDGRLLGDTG